MTIQEYNDLYKNPLIKKMRIISSGGIEITNTNICSEEMSLEESLCSDDNLTIGACEAACFKIRIADLNHDFTGEWLDVEQKLDTDIDGFLLLQGGGYLLLEGGGRLQLESIDGTAKYGRFKVFSDKPTNDRRWRDLTCYDAMYDILNAEVIEWYNGLTFPMTMKNFRDSFFTFLGYTQKTQTLVNDGFQIQGGFSNEGSLSGKTIITSICELNGVFGHISRDGQFEYISLPNADTIALDWYMDGTGAYEDYTVQKITGIIAKGSDDDVGTLVGTDDNAYVILNNPLTFGSEGTQSLTTALTNVLNNVKNITYRPFNVNTYGNPMLPLGTNLTVNTRNQTINSFVMTRVLSGIQSLKDSISAKGEKYRPTEVNSLRSETKRTKGKIHELINTAEELRSTIEDLDEEVSSEIQQLSDEIVLKVDASGNIVKVALTADASTGSTFSINADTIHFVANKTIDLVTGNIGITANNFSIDNAGNVTIAGTVHSNSGNIGGWTINSSGLCYGDPTRLDNDWMVIYPNLIQVNEYSSDPMIMDNSQFVISPGSLYFRDVISGYNNIVLDRTGNVTFELHSNSDIDQRIYGQNYGTKVRMNPFGVCFYTMDSTHTTETLFASFDPNGIKHIFYANSSDNIVFVDSTGQFQLSSITDTELFALSGITGNIQSRLAALEARI